MIWEFSNKGKGRAMEGAAFFREEQEEGGYGTVTVTCVLCTRVPETAVMVKV
jgi:hypothetical protein